MAAFTTRKMYKLKQVLFLYTRTKVLKVRRVTQLITEGWSICHFSIGLLQRPTENTGVAKCRTLKMANNSQGP